MGCDIHFYVEKKTPEGWKPVDPPHDGTEDGGLGWYLKYKDEDGDKAVCWDLGRNYQLFTVLAGVRDWADGRNLPIIPNRPGILPHDVSIEVGDIYHSWGADAHTACYYTLAELQAHSFDSPMYVQGVLPLSDAVMLKETGDGSFIQSWSGGIAGTGIETLAWDAPAWEREHQFDSYFGKVATKPKTYAKDMTAAQTVEWARGIERPYVQMQWSTKQREYVGHFVDTVIPAMAEVGAPNEVRCVFWFDN